MSEELTKPMAANRDNYLEAGKKLLAQIQSMDITISNFQEMYRNIKTTSDVLDTAISNLRQDYESKITKVNQQYDDMEKNPDKLYANYYPKEVCELQIVCIELLQKVFGYKALQQELSQVAYTKFANLVIAARAMETQNNLLKEMREIEDRRNTLFMQNTKVIIDNSLRATQKIADSSFNQNRDTTQILVEQNRDTYTFFMELLMRMRVNNTLPETDLKELSTMAKNIHKEFVSSVKEKSVTSNVELALEPAPEVPPLKQTSTSEPQKPDKKIKSLDDEDFDFDAKSSEE